MYVSSIFSLTLGNRNNYLAAVQKFEDIHVEEQVSLEIPSMICAICARMYEMLIYSYLL